MWEGAMEVSRRKTEPNVFRFFFLFIAIWIVFGLYVIFVLDPTSYRPPASDKDAEAIAEILLSSKWPILGCTVLAGILTVLYILMMRWWVKIMTYSIIFLFWTSMLALIILLMANSPQNKLEVDLKNVVLIALVIILVPSIISVVIFRKKISITCAMIQEAAKTVFSFPSHFLLPVVLCPLLFLAIVFALHIAITLFNHDNPNYDGKQSPKISAFSAIFRIYNVCAILWLWNFISGTNHMIYSSSFATWYWTMNKKDLPENTVSRSVHTVSRYHLGTVAYGSFTISITICEIMKALFRAITRGARENGEEATIIGCFSRCCENIMLIFEYVNRNAYTMSAIHGTDFSTSGKNTFNLIKRNIAKVLVTVEVTSLLFGMGVFISCLIPAVIYYIVADSTASFTEFCAVLISSLILSAALFAVLKSAVETIFICIIEDYERNDGSDVKPYYMNRKLKKLILNESSNDENQF